MWLLTLKLNHVGRKDQWWYGYDTECFENIYAIDWIERKEIGYFT